MATQIANLEHKLDFLHKKQLKSAQRYCDLEAYIQEHTSWAQFLGAAVQQHMAHASGGHITAQAKEVEGRGLSRAEGNDAVASRGTKDYLRGACHEFESSQLQDESDCYEPLQNNP